MVIRGDRASIRFDSDSTLELNIWLLLQCLLSEIKWNFTVKQLCVCNLKYRFYCAWSAINSCKEKHWNTGISLNMANNFCLSKQQMGPL